MKGKLLVILMVLCLLCVSLFSEAINEDFNLEESYYKAGKLIDKRNYKKAIWLYAQIQVLKNELNDYNRSRMYNNIGFCYHKLKKYRSAVENYKKALVIDEKYLGCLNNISASLIKLKKFNQALYFLERAYGLDKKKIKVVYNIFVVYANFKDKEKAKIYLKRAYLLDKTYTRKRLRRKMSRSQIAKIEKELFQDKGI